MKVTGKIHGLIVLVFLFVSCSNKQTVKNGDEYAGSKSCLECHEKFYALWSTSHHGKAMQQINAAFIQAEKIPSSEKFNIEGKIYSMLAGDSTLTMVETDKEKVADFSVIWALGGKNVFYFLTPLENGKLQTVPLAYDLNNKKWYNNPQSALRHFTGVSFDRPLPWKDRMFNFNTSCYSCHVSQLKSNFDLATDTYQTIWKEPGINCETCHGPASEHIRIFRNARKPENIKEPGLISTKKFSKEQNNWSCAPCHAKMHPITPEYLPGDRFFDNFDLILLDNPDFYPDGRDLGENYTYTGWLMNKCNAKSDLHCVTCHTSSGRDRFKDNPNDACSKCHSELAENVVAHSGHKAGSPGAVCVNCHMPQSYFGNMKRSDHSFRPPMPEATIKFKSPNACNLCHKDKTPEWADKIVKQRLNPDYQDETIRWATLLNSARQGKWERLHEMLDIIVKDELDEVVVASFVRTLGNCPENEKWPVIIKALNSKSPLVRSSAAASLTGYFSDEAQKALLGACSDEYRVVRIAAASALASFPKSRVPSESDQQYRNAMQEYITSLNVHPDDWSSHYNLGIFYEGQGEYGKALDSYETAVRLYPDALLPLVNSSVLYSSQGNQAKALENLKKALAIDSLNEAANLNYGLFSAEQGNMDDAENAFKIALKTNPKQAVAAYNLSVICSRRNIDEAVGYARIAAESLPGEPKYGYTLAFYLLGSGKKAEAITILRGVISKNPLFVDAYKLLADTYIRNGRRDEAKKIYMQALNADGISDQNRVELQQIISQLH